MLSIAPYGVKVMGNWNSLRSPAEPVGRDDGTISAAPIRVLDDRVTGSLPRLPRARRRTRRDAPGARASALHECGGSLVAAPASFSGGASLGACECDPGRRQADHPRRDDLQGWHVVPGQGSPSGKVSRAASASVASRDRPPWSLSPGGAFTVSATVDLYAGSPLSGTMTTARGSTPSRRCPTTGRLWGSRTIVPRFRRASSAAGLSR